MAIFKIAEQSVTAPSDGSAGIIITSSPTLVDETYSLVGGYVNDGSTPIVGAAVILVEIVSDTATNKAISYTDVDGKFGIPYEFSTTEGTTYQLDVYTPNPLS